MTNQLKADPLFVGLTRPPMIFGVSVQYAVLNMLGCVMIFILTSDFRVLVLALVIHLIGYVLCFKEPLFVEIFMMRTSRFNKCSNKYYYGANSYGI